MLKSSQAKKNIACTSSFGKTVTSLDELSEAVSSYTTRAAEKLRGQRSVASLISVFIHTNFFSTTDQPYTGSLTLELPVATSDTSEMIHYALMALGKIYLEGYAYKKAGLILNGILLENHIQTNLFDGKDRYKTKFLMQVLRVRLMHGGARLGRLRSQWHREGLAHAFNHGIKAVHEAVAGTNGSQVVERR